MKPVLLLILFLPLWLLLSYSAEAQKKKRREIIELIITGNEYYQGEQYHKAASFYGRALEFDSLNTYASYHLGECYRNTFEFNKALQQYEQVVDQDISKYPDALFYYPLMQKLEGKFASAIYNFNKFIAYVRENSFENSELLLKKAEIEKAGCLFAIEQLANPFGDYEFNNLGIPVNSPYNDYGPWILQHDSSMVFTSGRSTVKGNLENNRYGEFFPDNFRYKKDSAQWQPIDGADDFNITNTKLSEGAGSFNEERTKFYFTGCYLENKCGIYVSVLKNGKWGTPKLLNSNINKEETDNKQPSLSSGADTLFFVSDRPGGYGGNDIWMSVADSTQESWGVPVNLGSNINTSYNEVSPYFYKEEKLLFFASDGHQGFGGLDIFMAKGEVLSEAEIDNIGYPFNSNSDDCYLVMGETKGYLSSNRDGGIGGFDIYSFNIITAQSMIAEVNDGSGGRSLRSRVRNMSESDVLVMRDEDKFFYENLRSEEKEITDRLIAAKLAALNGFGEGFLNPDDEAYYKSLSKEERSRIDRIAELLYISKAGNVGQLINISNSSDKKYVSITIMGDLYEASTGQPASYIQIPLVDEQNEVVKVTTSNVDGSFKYTDLPLNENFKIIADNSPKKFTQPLKYYVKNLIITGKEKEQELLENAVVTEFENIYFDVNEFGLRKEAKRVLDEVAAYYHENPDIQVELFTYTDSTGSDDYNLILSEKRGKAAYDYLLEKGMDHTALIVRAQGNGTPAASNETLVGRQINRRLEFSIVGASCSYMTDVATFITKKAITLKELAQLTKNSIEELQQYNDLVVNTVINPYTPVRIRTSDDQGQMDKYLEKSVIHAIQSSTL